MTDHELFDTAPDDSPEKPNGAHLTPAQNPTRRVSGGNSVARNGELSPENAQWSSAVGHATTGGKSGRVIEKLMADSDRLKRELKEQVIKAEELQRSLQTYKPRIEALQTENENLSHARGVDQALLARRDRMIADLKEELKQEKESRLAFEKMSQKLSQERDEAVEEKQRDTQSLRDQTKHAQNHSDILQNSHRQMSAEYKARVESMRLEMQKLQQEREEDRARLARLDVVYDQMRQEQERTRKLQVELVEKWEELQHEKQQRFQDLEEETRVENARSKKLSAEMEEAVNQMRWLMNVKQNVRLEEKEDA